MYSKQSSINITWIKLINDIVVTDIDTIHLLIPPLPVLITLILVVLPLGLVLDHYDLVEEVLDHPLEVPEPAELIKVSNGRDSCAGITENDHVTGQYILGTTGRNFLK